MHDCDWLGKAFTLSLISYTSTRERAMCHSNWPWPCHSDWPCFRMRKYGVEISANELYGIKFSCYV